MWTDPLRALAGGVLWIDADTDVEAMFTELGDTWTTARIRVDPGATKQATIASIGSALGFPDWAGTNLDALYDLLTDLSWLDDGRNVALALERSTEAGATPLDGWQQIVQVLLDTAAWWQPDPRSFIAVLR